MENYVKYGDLMVASVLAEFVNQQAIPGTGLSVDKFWSGFQTLIEELAPENERLLKKREELQHKLNEWHREHRDHFRTEEYTSFLEKIGYLEPVVEDFTIRTENVDDEIVRQAGPQLVVPVNNARYAINAANARWGSLYDAFYGTDVIGDEDGMERGSSYNPLRGQRVISMAKEFLDTTIPLQIGSHKDVVTYSVANNYLEAHFIDGSTTLLAEPKQFLGYQGIMEKPETLLFKNNNLHFEICIDYNHPIGASDKAGVKDIVLESALTTIMDFEDSVAAVDAMDKVEVYNNWLGLMKGNLTATFQKGEKTIVRRLNEDKTYRDCSGSEFSLRGRSLLLARNVGHLMTSEAILYGDEKEIPEGIMDGVISGLIAKHDLLGTGNYLNSKKGSVYIVKPKMHGSDEVEFANQLFNCIEDLLELKRNTLKIGVMDEERRTTLNLKNCINKVKDRLVFINTGFLDRTGDEIHTSMEAGPMIRKNDMRSSKWLKAYEVANVVVGINAGLPGRAQIGKGMWAMPDLMAEMVKQKIGHLKAGANTAWVPSPTAATLHALHYHELNVAKIHDSFKTEIDNLRTEILTFPVDNTGNWSAEEIQQELNNNAQGILGYVVRWVEQGIGCSKVPDINNIGLMEDRATLRISSQHLANWLHHGICSTEQVMETLERMASVVDEQNLDDPNYCPMSADYQNSIAFQAACELVFEGVRQPSGYTEPILHRRRLEAKRKQEVSVSK
ncbi:malate synthase G [Anaerobacillus alkaliphilus]|uniref:Malate synthase G n=1 Tax=Anaerobacillus alkaliphilus TaxID=1548597 RepID=A0A4Q0VQ20_9BACI|nr:malate synthase G [Anaerobacillus alkaliphilus]RXI98201.1 malate synthase G [Anaerobacillus alkaliphilus]